MHVFDNAGAANNQLETAEDAIRLEERGILFAPDYVINSGGIICAGREYIGGSTRQQLEDEVHRIPHRLNAILDGAERSNRPASTVADEMAETVISNGVLPDRHSHVHAMPVNHRFRNSA